MPLVVSAMTLLGCIGDTVNAQTAKKKKDSSGLPTLKMLPEGSVLKNVKLPRYDDNFSPLSLLTADCLTVGDRFIINGLNVFIQIYNKDESVKLQTRMAQATFDQRKSILKSTEHTVIQGENFSATGTAFTLNEQSRQGFLKGPATTKFLIPNKKSSTAMNLDNLTKPLTKPITAAAKKVATGTLITATSGMLMAERPSLLDGDEIQQLDKQATSLKEQVISDQTASKAAIKKADQIQAVDDKQMASFLKKIGEEEVLTKEPNIKPPNTKDAPNKGFDLPFPAVSNTQETLTIQCDDGIYFDAQKEVLVYLKNIRLTSPEYKMSCSDALKVHLTPKKDGAQNKDKKELNSTDKINRIVATGDIVFIGKDAKGNTYVARSEEAHYDAKTQTMILRGGYPSIQQSANQYLKSEDENGYIRIPINGNAVTSPTSWVTKIVIPKK